MQCHRTSYSFSFSPEGKLIHGRSVLGFFTAQLNRLHVDSAHLNQIEYFFRKNVFSGTKPIYAIAPKWHGINDPAGTDDQKARAYIASNCSGCHGLRGMSAGATHGVSLDFDYHTNEARFEFRHQPTSWSYGLADIEPFFYPKTGEPSNPGQLDSLPIMPALVVPGYPEKSVLLFRQTQLNSAPPKGVDEDFYPTLYQMPPLGVFEKDLAALTLMAHWIKNMPRGPNIPIIPVSISSPSGRMNLKGPAIQGRVLVIPSGLSESGRARVSMTAITGRTVELAPTTRTTFAIPAHLPRGVYIIKVGSKTFVRNLF